jgi:hypothetical protein
LREHYKQGRNIGEDILYGNWLPLARSNALAF